MMRTDKRTDVLENVYSYSQEAMIMRDTINGIILVGMLALGMFVFFAVGELRDNEAVVVTEQKVEHSIEEEVALTEAETLEAHILAKRDDEKDDKTTWFAAE